MWNAKLDVLVEKWYIIFTTKCNGLAARQARELREQILVECEKEMSDASTAHIGSNLSYTVHYLYSCYCAALMVKPDEFRFMLQAHLLELREDLSTYIDQLPAEVEFSTRCNPIYLECNTEVNASCLCDPL
jgi:hypothetical protein